MPKTYYLHKNEMPDILAMEPKMRSKVLRRAARVLKLAIQARVPVRSGLLRKAIRYTVSRGALQAKVRATKAPHAHLVHDGTKAHTIHAKTKESARAGWQIYHGSIHTAVKHPGSRGNPFMTDAAEESSAEVERVMKQTAKEVLAEVAAGR